MSIKFPKKEERFLTDPKKKVTDAETLNLELTNKLKKFRAKFNITKERLFEEDILLIIKEIESENNHNSNIEISNKNYLDIVKQIFKDLDKEKKGYVITNSLIEKLLSKQYSTNSNSTNTNSLTLTLNTEENLKDSTTSNFYNSVNKVLHSKSEDIIARLKNLKKKSWIIGNDQLSKSITFIIRSITEANLNELDSDEFSKKLEKNKNQQGIDFLVQYSKIEDSKQKERDIVTLRKKSKMFSSSNKIKSNTNSVQTSSSNYMNKKKRTTTLLNMISPSIIARVYNQISKINQCDFNIFELDELMGKKASIYIASEILGKFEILEDEIVEPDTFKNFVDEIVANYDRKNAIYHNDLHAADVMQTVFTIITKGDMATKMKLGELDVFAILVGALCHDYKHTGQNNLFHINTKSKIAMRYNDISVLENYHVAQSFKVMSRKQFNILKNFSPEEYRIFRRRMVEGILSTDMANHQKVLHSAKTKVALYNISSGTNFENIFNDPENNKSVVKHFDNQQCILNLILHCSDILNAGKPNKISEQWTKMVYTEFFIQGDKEKQLGLPVSSFCDRETTNINKAMIGFIKFVVSPTIDLLVNLIPEVSDYSDYCRSNLRKHEIALKNEEKLESLKKKEK